MIAGYRVPLQTLLIAAAIGLLPLGAIAPAAPVSNTAAGQLPPPVAELAQRAVALEQAGRKLEAAAVYEQILAQDPAPRPALTHRLVTLYAEAGAADRALRWAREVMRTNPDPQAYLAGVYALVRQYPDARAILDREIAKASDPRRKLTLRWQLADVWAKAGKPDEAEKVLRTAAAEAKGSPDEAAANRRLARRTGRAAEAQRE